jgi:hypothetical protein
VRTQTGRETARTTVQGNGGSKADPRWSSAELRPTQPTDAQLAVRTGASPVAQPHRSVNDVADVGTLP